MNRLTLLIGILIYTQSLTFSNNLFNIQEFPRSIYTNNVEQATEELSFTTVSITNIITNSVTNITKQEAPLENTTNEQKTNDQNKILQTESVEIVQKTEEIIEENSSPSQPVDSADIKKFIEASRSGDLDTMKVLLAKGVPVDSRTKSNDSNGSTVLMCAAGERRIQGMLILLNAGADPNLTASNKNIGNITALMIAAIVGPLENVVNLINFGADVNAKTTGTVSGSTALMAAIGAQRLDIVKALVEAGANINSKTGGENITGVTALMLAAETGNEAIIKYLLSLPNIEINSEDSEKKSALVYAYISGNTSIVNTLMNAGAKTSLSPQKLKNFVQRSLT